MSSGLRAALLVLVAGAGFGVALLVGRATTPAAEVRVPTTPARLAAPAAASIAGLRPAAGLPGLVEPSPQRVTAGDRTVGPVTPTTATQIPPQTQVSTQTQTQTPTPTQTPVDDPRRTVGGG